MKKLFKIGIYIFLLFSLNSCIILRSDATKSSVKNGAIPPSFGKDVRTLIFVYKTSSKFDEKYERKMRKIVANNYTGEYEFVDSLDLFKVKYYDKSEYRFMFTYKIQGHTTPGPVDYSVSTSNYSEVCRFYVLDRVDYLGYTCKTASGGPFFTEIAKSYLLKLDQNRIEENP